MSKQGELDIIFVLISVADNDGVLMRVDCKNRVKLRFRAGFKTDIVFVAVAYDLLNHGAHLVDLDRIDDEVLGLVFILPGCFLEAVGNLADPVVEDVWKAQKQRRVHVAELERVHNLLYVDRSATLFGCDLNMPLVVD